MAEQKPANRLLAVSSGGGHWDEMMLVRASLADYEVIYASTIPHIGAPLGISSVVLTDFNRNHPMRVAKAFFGAFTLIRKTRPAVIFSTGAAPGVIVLMAGKLLKVRTVWLDSIANAETLSLSGRLAALFVDLHLTQWEHLADGKRSKYLGRVL